MKKRKAILSGGIIVGITALFFWFVDKIGGNAIWYPISIPIGYIFFGILVLLAGFVWYATNCVELQMKRRRAFFSSITDFVEKESMQGVQLFQIQREEVELLGIKYSVSYLGGYTKKNVNTNCIMSEHYCCQDETLGHAIESAFDLWRKFCEKKPGSKDYSYDDYADEYRRLITKFTKLGERIAIKCRELLEKNTIEESYFFYYRALQVISAIFAELPHDKDDLLSDTPPSDIKQLAPASSVSDKYFLVGDTFERYLPRDITPKRRENLTKKMKEIENQLKTKKRTGLLGSILYGMPYVFGNTTNPSKASRRYFCIPVDVDTENKSVYAVGLFEIPPGRGVDDNKETLRSYENTIEDLKKSVFATEIKGVLG